MFVDVVAEGGAVVARLLPVGIDFFKRPNRCAEEILHEEALWSLPNLELFILAGLYQVADLFVVDFEDRKLGSIAVVASALPNPLEQ